MTYDDNGNVIAPPRQKRPPIEGMPAERPACAGCGKKLRPSVRNHYDRESWPRNIVRREWVGWDSYNGIFHSLNCALLFATLAHRAGYRLRGIP